MSALLIPLVAAVAYLMTPQPRESVVLLPDADGKVGAVVIKTAAGEQVLDRAYAAVEVDARGAMNARSEDVASVKARYGAALDARPPRPVSFTVNFSAGSATELTAESLPVLEQLKSALATRPAPELTVIGHTDRVGKLEANDDLSAKRAAAVRDLLIAAGIKAQAMEVAGRGEREPMVATADEVAEVKNRRVEISIR